MTKEEFRAWCEGSVAAWFDQDPAEVETFCKMIGQHDKKLEAMLRRLNKSQDEFIDRCQELCEKD